MRTEDPKVFAAGDGAFGGSTIVKAMFHGHRAAYYVKSFLDGIEDPLPYRTPYRTRRVPVAQDANWEVFPRQEQEFHGVGENPVAFPEIESTYDAQEARDEAARCYRCDAETGSADYNVRTREDVFVMARTRPEDADTQRAILNRRLGLRADPFTGGHRATFDDLVFLPANLSRLVIDPYRDSCNLKVTLTGGVGLEMPFLVTGFDAVPSEVRAALGPALAQVGSAYVGRTKLDGDAPWLQIVGPGETADSRATGHAWLIEGDGPAALPARQDGKTLGVVLKSSQLEAMLPVALEAGADFAVLDATAGIAGTWPELASAPDFMVMRDAIRILRRLNREEDIDLLYFGGVRSGTDCAKAIGLGANAAIVGVGMALALGGEILMGGDIAFHGDRSLEERTDAAASILNALAAESSIMARCTGKTDVRNVEPEDLRAITIATSEATGIPLAGAKPTAPTPIAAE